MRLVRIVSSILSCFIAVTHSPPGALAADPFGISGDYLTERIPFAPLTAINTGGSNYEIVVKGDSTDPVLGCKIAGGSILARFTSTDATAGTADLYIPPSDETCDFTLAAPSQPAKLVIQPDSITIDFVSASQSDVVFARVGPPIVIQDFVKPTVKTFTASGKAGTKIALLYSVTENSGFAAVTLTVYNAGKILKVFDVPLAAYKTSKKNSVTWKAPAKISGNKYRFEVIATDTSNNTSIIAAGKIKLTK